MSESDLSRQGLYYSFVFELWFLWFVWWRWLREERKKHRRCVIVIAMQNKKRTNSVAAISSLRDFLDLCAFHIYYDDATTLLFPFRWTPLPMWSPSCCFAFSSKVRFPSELDLQEGKVWDYRGKFFSFIPQGIRLL